MPDEIQAPPQAPPTMASYPRAGQMSGIYGTSEKLTRLYRGYHGLSYTFLFIILAYCLFFATIVTYDQVSPIVGVLVGIATVASVVAGFYFSIRSCKDIAFGCSWKEVTGIILGIVVPFGGLIVYVVMQMLAINEIKNYGVSSGPFSGVKGRLVKAKIEELRSLESSPSMPV